MKIGIVGSNDRAMAIGRLLRSGGHQVTFASTMGARGETPYRQAMCSDLLVLAVPRQEVDLAVAAVGSGAGAVIVDAVEGERGDRSLSGAEILAQKLNSRRVVRALINMPQSGADVAICGDDPTSKGLVGQALRSCGCLATDCGPLVNSAQLEAPA